MTEKELLVFELQRLISPRLAISIGLFRSDLVYASFIQKRAQKLYVLSRGKRKAHREKYRVFGLFSMPDLTFPFRKGWN